MPSILCNGNFPRSRRCLDSLRDSRHLVCCDGAIAELDAWGGRAPDAIVGDLDSIPRRLLDKYSDRLFRETEQDTNDLSKAIRFCKAKYPGEGIIILGGEGKREDHLLGNIAILADTDNAEMWTDYGRFLPVKSEARLHLPVGSQISFIAISPETRITTTGVRWPVKEQHFQRWWMGTLNETVDEEVVVKTDGAAPLLVYIPWMEAAGKAPLAEIPRLPWRRVHFCGAGGVGVSGLAHLMLDAGATVTGSDSVDSGYVRRLRERGARISVGDEGTALSPKTDLLVHSAAVPADNPERRMAASLGIPQCSRGEFLARVAPFFRRVIAVSGSHGKTSTVAMIAHILRKVLGNPGYLVGGNVAGWNRNASWGDGGIFVTEVDESDRSQELMLPFASIVLNIDDDHSWAIGGASALDDSFRRLARQSLFAFANDTPETRRALDGLSQVSFIEKDTDLESLLEEAGVKGAHARANAAAACAVLTHPAFGISRDEIVGALRDFPGVDRRMSLLAVARGRLLYEDYAHHPSELKACFQTIREIHPEAHIRAYFQPHRPERILRYGARFARLLDEYCEKATILQPFMAWEENAPNADAKTIVDAVNETSPRKAELFTGKPEELLPQLADDWKNAPAGTLFILIGAGDIGKLATLAKEALEK